MLTPLGHVVSTKAEIARLCVSAFGECFMIRIGVGQTQPKIGDKAWNTDLTRRLLRAAEDESVDVVVLPELLNSGYVFSSKSEAADLSEDIPSGPFSKLLQESSRKGLLIVSGICQKQGNLVYNSAAAFANGALLTTYQKLHLFDHESEWFSSGNKEPPVVEFQGYRFGIMICFDWAFPEVARILALKSAQVILHPANLVLPYCQDAMRTRSIENRVFTATANRTGLERDVQFSGMSQVTNPRGEVLLRQGGTEEGLFWVDIDPLEADDKMITSRNHVLRDRRPEVYTILTKTS
jgi:predicted amidohydrolase